MCFLALVVLCRGDPAGRLEWPRCVIKSCCIWRRRLGKESRSEKHERTDKWGRRDGGNRLGPLSLPLETFTM